MAGIRIGIIIDVAATHDDPHQTLERLYEWRFAHVTTIAKASAMFEPSNIPVPRWWTDTPTTIASAKLNRPLDTVRLAIRALQHYLARTAEQGRQLPPWHGMR